MSEKDELKHIVRIRRNSDGRVASFHTSVAREYAPNQEDGYFMWEEGNYACDCNRYIFFCEAVGEPEDEDEESPNHLCGSSRYSVLDITFEDGQVFYPDGNPPRVPR